MAVQREYLSPNEIAEYLGVSPFTIRRYIKLGELRAVKLLGGFRVHRDDLQGFLKAHEVNPAEEELSPEEVTADPVAPPAETPDEAPPAQPVSSARRGPVVAPRTTSRRKAQANRAKKKTAEQTE